MKLALPSIDRERAEPLYLQIRKLLLRAIEKEELLPHQRVPSERTISDLTGVSRMTVRQALQSLIADGLLYTVTGKGTFVAGERKIQHNLQRLSGFTEEVRAQGITASSRILSVEIVQAGEPAAEALEIDLETPLIRIARLRLADEAPVALETTHLVQATFPGLVRIDHSTYSLYELLLNEYGIQLKRAEQTIEAVEADDEVAELLGIPVEKPILAMERVTYTVDDRPVEYVRSAYRADRFQLKVELYAGNPTERSAVSNVFLP